MPRLFVLDAMGLAYRAYYAFIRRPLLNSRGENTSAIFGVANVVLKIRREERPTYLVPRHTTIADSGRISFSCCGSRPSDGS